MDLSQEVEFTNVISAVQINEVVKLASRLGTEPLQFDFKAKFNGVSLHWKYQALRKGNARYIHAGRIPSSQKHRGVLIAGGYRGHTIARNSARRARTLLQKLRVRIITRSRFVSTWWIPAVYPHLVYTEMSSEKTNTVHGNAKLVLCASGDSEAGVRGSTGWNLDRPCAPPHFWTSRLYDAV